MNIRVLITGLLFLSSVDTAPGQDSHIRGELIWNSERQTVTECKSGRIYWVRVLVSNPWGHLTQNVKELTQKGASSIVVEFQGELELGKPSFGPPYHVDGTLTVNKTISLKQGKCEN